MSFKESNPKDLCAVASHRLDLSLVPDTAVAYCALALTEGHLKYRAYNWRVAGAKASVYVAAARRHLAKWWNGEERDPTTQVPHLASVLASIAILVDAGECGMLSDDRPPKAGVGHMLTAYESRVAHLAQLFPGAGPRWTDYLADELARTETDTEE